MTNIVMSWPNVLTFSRIVVIPFFILAFYLPFSFARTLAAALFFLACFTDWLDGYLARKLKQSSSFGAFLDPVADKLLVSTSLLLLVGSNTLPFITLPAVVIVGREIAISALREWMAEMGKRVSVAVSYMGKIKTGLQMVAIFLLIAYGAALSKWAMIGIGLLYVAAGLTLWSMAIYLMVAWTELVYKKENSEPTVVDRT